MARLTQHIPEKLFKIIRYYGIYSRHRKSDNYLRRAVSREKHKIFLSFNRWRDSILLFFGYDPLKCPSCCTTMLFLELYFNHKPVPLHELYERVMRKHRCGLLSLFFLFHSLLTHDTIKVSDVETEAIHIKRVTEAELAKELREQYMKNPPEGITSDEIRDMSDDDLWDMDYFLHEFDDLEDDDFGEEGFYIF